MGVLIPRLVIAGLSGDSGKTIASLSLVTALRQRGLAIAAFKKGPDFIDPAWLAQASGGVCRNLDTFMVDPSDVFATFVSHAPDSDVAVVEGNRGLYDGSDVSGTHSTAQLAKLIKAPVVLVVNATKVTRTVAALVKGCQVFDPEVRIAGVILNKVSGTRHREIISKAIETYCNLPVVGAIPKLGEDASLIPGRHLGLVPPAEFGAREEYESKLIEIARDYLDIDKILEIAKDTEPLEPVEAPAGIKAGKDVRIGYFSDTAFTFYYPENLERLEESGAELVPVSSLEESDLPEIDGLYIGGGFPETHAARLAQNSALMDDVKRVADAGMPIFAECGGLIYLSRTLTWRGNRHRMAGVFPIDLDMTKRPSGHGYSELVCDKTNPFFDLGAVVRGHEFHYSKPAESGSDCETCFQVKKGVGVGGERDGLLYRSTLASYTHIHADGVRSWADKFVHAARGYRENRMQSDQADDSEREHSRRRQTLKKTNSIRDERHPAIY